MAYGLHICSGNTTVNIQLFFDNSSVLWRLVACDWFHIQILRRYM